jgi:hypothetical protein
MQLADTDDLALWYALNRLMTNYWADVDGNSGSQAHEFYLSDALYAVGANRDRDVRARSGQSHATDYGTDRRFRPLGADG